MELIIYLNLMPKLIILGAMPLLRHTHNCRGASEARGKLLDFLALLSVFVCINVICVCMYVVYLIYYIHTTVMLCMSYVYLFGFINEKFNKSERKR